MLERTEQLLNAIQLATIAREMAEKANKAKSDFIKDTSLTSFKHFKVLVAEDNEVNQKIILLMLKILGINADIAANGLEVLEALKIKSYNIILMDIQMPEMDGIETTLHIKDYYKKTSEPVIIALTANALPGDKEKYLQIGMNDYLSKPVEEKKLIAVFSRWANQSKKLSENRKHIEKASEKSSTL